MKRVVLSLALVFFLIQRSLVAQELKEEMLPQIEIEPTVVEEPPVARKPKKDSNLQNWLFAGGSLISATIAIVIVSLNQGAHASSTTQ